MRKSVTRKLNLTYTLVRWGLGFVFVVSGTLKLFDPQEFSTVIAAYGIVPDGLVINAAVFLAGLELLAGFGLMCDIRGSLAVITGLLVLFTAVMGYGILLGLDIDCGCFGPGDPEAKAFHGFRAVLSRDVLMMAMVMCLYIWRRIGKIDPNGFKSLFKKEVLR